LKPHHRIFFLTRHSYPFVGTMGRLGATFDRVSWHPYPSLLAIAKRLPGVLLNAKLFHVRMICTYRLSSCCTLHLAALDNMKLSLLGLPTLISAHSVLTCVQWGDATLENLWPCPQDGAQAYHPAYIKAGDTILYEHAEVGKLCTGKPHGASQSTGGSGTALPKMKAGQTTHLAWPTNSKNGCMPPVFLDPSASDHAYIDVTDTWDNYHKGLTGQVSC
jgi:hypothetical protein